MRLQWRSATKGKRRRRPLPTTRPAVSAPAWETCRTELDRTETSISRRLRSQGALCFFVSHSSFFLIFFPIFNEWKKKQFLYSNTNLKKKKINTLSTVFAAALRTAQALGFRNCFIFYRCCFPHRLRKLHVRRQDLDYLWSGFVLEYKTCLLEYKTCLFFLIPFTFYDA